MKRSTRFGSYRAIEADMRRRADNGEWPKNSYLPSRRELARHYGVEVNTFQRAIAPLVADGILRTDGRRGTVVAVGHSEGSDGRATAQHSADSPPEARTALGTAKMGIVVPANVSAGEAYVASDSWYYTIIDSLSRSFSAAGGGAVELLFREGHADLSSSVVDYRGVIKTIAADGVGAVAVVLDNDLEDVDALLRNIGEHEIPTVFIGSRALESQASHVYYDGHSAGYQAARHLIDRGYRELLFFAPFDAWWVRDRLAGVQSALAHYQGGAALRVVHDQTIKDSMGLDKVVAAYELAGRHLGLIQRDIGIVAANDMVAIGLTQRLSEAGMAAGQDYGLIGFDNVRLAGKAGISSMEPPLVEMGAEAGRMLVQALSGNRAAAQIRLRSHLIARTSTMKPYPAKGQ